MKFELEKFLQDLDFDEVLQIIMKEKISFLSVFIGLIMISSMVCSQSATPPANKHIAIQEALDALSTGSSIPYAEPIDGPGRTVIGVKVVNVHEAEMFISSYLFQALGMKAGSEYSQISALADPVRITERLEKIETTLVEDIERHFEGTIQEFFSNPSEPNVNRFLSVIHIFKTDVVQKLLEMNFALDQRSPADASDVRSLKPLYLFLYECSVLLEQVKTEHLKFSDDVVARQFLKVKHLYEKEIQFHSNEYMNTLKVMNVQLTESYGELRGNPKPSVEIMNTLMTRLEDAFYDGFVEAVKTYKLSPEEQALVLEDLEKIDVRMPLLSSLRITLPSDKHFERTGFRFLRTILMQKFDMPNASSGEMARALHNQLRISGVTLGNRIRNAAPLTSRFDRFRAYATGVVSPEQRRANEVTSRTMKALRALKR